MEDFHHNAKGPHPKNCGCRQCYPIGRTCACRSCGEGRLKWYLAERKAGFVFCGSLHVPVVLGLCIVIGTDAWPENLGQRLTLEPGNYDMHGGWAGLPGGQKVVDFNKLAKTQ